MKNTKSVMLLILVLVYANTVIAADLDAGKKDINKSFKVKSGQKLLLELEIGADIIIEGWDKNELVVNAKLKGDVEDIEVEFDETSAGVEVYAGYSGWGNNNNTGGVFRIKVPSEFDVKFTTMGGDIDFSKVAGVLSGQTMGGDVKLNMLKGEVHITTMGGDIKLTDSDVDGYVKTMGGDVNVINVTGNVDAKSMGGDIRQKNVKRRSGDSVGDEVHISTMGGDIDVDEAPFGAKVKTMGGDVSINKAEKYVDANTMGGDISVKSVDGWVKAVTMGGEIYVKFIGDPDSDDKNINLKSMNGDIRLIVPSGFSMDLDLDVVYEMRYEDDVEIISDFNIVKKHSEEWEREDGHKRKHLYGTASLNGGKNKVKITTYNARIYLESN